MYGAPNTPLTQRPSLQCEWTLRLLSHSVFPHTIVSQGFISMSHDPTLAFVPSSTSSSKSQSHSPLFLRWQPSKTARYTESEITVIVEEVEKKLCQQGHSLVVCGFHYFCLLSLWSILYVFHLWFSCYHKSYLEKALCYRGTWLWR